MTVIKQIIEGRPLPLERARITRNGNYLPQRSKDYKNFIIACLYIDKIAPMQLITGKIEINIVFYMKPSRASKKQMLAQIGTPHLKRPDLDNLVKAILDAYNGIVWQDDSQIYCIQAQKIYCNKERTEIKVLY